MKKVILVMTTLLFLTAAQAQEVAPSPIINIDTLTGVTTVNWPQLRQIIISCSNLKPFTGKDSVDYLSEVYYSTPYKLQGFDRSAIKRNKKKGNWWFEAIYKTEADTMQVKRDIIGLYQALKKSISENTGTDFTMGISAKEAISAPDAMWLIQWYLDGDNPPALLPQGLGKVKIILELVRFDSMIHPGVGEYTIKMYIHNSDVKLDVYGWDKPE